MGRLHHGIEPPQEQKRTGFVAVRSLPDFAVGKWRFQALYCWGSSCSAGTRPRRTGACVAHRAAPIPGSLPWCPGGKSWSWALAGATSRSATRARRRASCAPQHQRQGEPEQQRSDAALLKRMDTVAALTGCQLLLRNVETLVGVIDILLDLIKQRLNLRAQAPGSGGVQVRALASPKPAADTVAA